MAGALNRHTVSHRVGKRYANLNDVTDATDPRQGIGETVGARIAGSYERDQADPAGRARRFERVLYGFMRLH